VWGAGRKYRRATIKNAVKRSRATRAKNDALSKAVNEYIGKFGGLPGGRPDGKCADRSLKTGKDAYALYRAYHAKFGHKPFQSYYLGNKKYDIRTGYDELAAEREAWDREQAELMATPMEAERVPNWTKLIKKRRLYEGACDEMTRYMLYLDKHGNTELDADDIAYASKWAACTVKPVTRAAKAAKAA
jgi:hypothetical protein